MNKWTSEQQNAIDAENRSVIVSAAAGSGKTAVLVARLMRIISDRENPLPVEKMIVVTFTNDAAAEMKQRLSSELTRAIENAPDNKWLSRQHAMLGNASISTIHSFCFDLIRNNISSLSLSSDFRIIDETEEIVLKDSVLKNLMDNYYKTNPDMMKLLNDYFCGNNDKPLCTMILDIYRNISSIPFYNRWLAKLDDIYDSGIYLKEYKKSITNNLRNCRRQTETEYNIAESIADEKILAVLDEDKTLLDKITDYYADEKYDELQQFVSGMKFKNFPNMPKDGSTIQERQAIKNIRENIKDTLKDISSKINMVKNYETDIDSHKKIMSYLSEILCKFSSELMKAKEEKNAVCFDDAEQIALNLLAECDSEGHIKKTRLAEELSDFYQIIMIDEFQDSNNRQDMIFRLLSRNGSYNEYGNNLFFVGDVKQSIYRFRLANPDNFINAVNISVPYKKDILKNSYIKLNKNFRSSSEVINFVNYIFENIMSATCGDIDYNEDEFLVKGADFCDAKRNTTIMLIDKSDKTTAVTDEAMCIAKKIRRMLDKKNTVSTNRGQGRRNCEMKDFCILLRTKKNIPVYAKALESLGITVNCDDESGYLKSREISVLMNLLRVIDNPLSDIPLASVMLSPMFMFNADELSNIRLIDNKRKLYNNVCDALGLSSGNPLFSENDYIYKKLKFLYDVISELRMLSTFCTLPELIQKIYDSTDFLSVIQLYKDSDKKRANLRMLLEYANSYEGNSAGGVSGFVRYIDRIMESKGDFKSGSSSGSSQNGVFIKTMHKSKGLEFPFVFIAESSTKFSTQDKIKPYQFSYNLGLGFKLQNKANYEKYTTIPYEVISKSIQNQLVSEEMRLFYVALTRAKERLFITLDIQKNAASKAMEFASEITALGKITPGIVQKASSMSDWLFMTLITHRKSGALREKLGIYECYTNDADFRIDYEEYMPEENESEIIDKTDADFSESDETLVSEIHKVFEFEYDQSNANLSSKLSVSDIAKNNIYSDILLSKPKFARSESGLTNAEKGTALHKFLQFAEFEKLENDFDSELNRILSGGYISREQADSIRLQDIDSFINSELYQLIKNAKNVLRERKFLISIDELELNDDFGEKYSGTDGMLNGIIDMIIENEDTLILADYKTDRINDTDAFVGKYKKQLLLYKKAAEKIYNKPVTSAIIYSFYLQTEIRIL